METSVNHNESKLQQCVCIKIISSSDFDCHPSYLSYLLKPCPFNASAVLPSLVWLD